MTHDAVLVFAKTWGALYLLAFFVCAVIWTYRPSKREQYRDAAHQPLEKDDTPWR